MSEFFEQANSDMGRSLTMWGTDVSAQMRRHPNLHVPPATTDLPPRITRTESTVLVLAFSETAPRSPEQGHPYVLGEFDIERLRDLFYAAQAADYLEPMMFAGPDYSSREVLRETLGKLLEHWEPGTIIGETREAYWEANPEASRTSATFIAHSELSDPVTVEVLIRRIIGSSTVEWFQDRANAAVKPSGVTFFRSNTIVAGQVPPVVDYRQPGVYPEDVATPGPRSAEGDESTITELIAHRGPQWVIDQLNDYNGKLDPKDTAVLRYATVLKPPGVYCEDSGPVVLGERPSKYARNRIPGVEEASAAIDADTELTVHQRRDIQAGTRLVYRHRDQLINALCHTVEYVGLDALPPIKGWSWYDALREADPKRAERFLHAWQDQEGGIVVDSVHGRLANAWEEGRQAGELWREAYDEWRAALPPDWGRHPSVLPPPVRQANPYPLKAN